MGRPTTIKVGDVNGNLEVISVKTFGAGNQAVAVCKCVCGSKTDVKRANLKKMKSCGCLRYDKEFVKPRSKDSYQTKPSGSAAIHSFFCGYRAKARRHGNPFELTKDEFVYLVSQPCTYCGAPPKERMPYKKNGEPMYNGSAYASGLDRVDNGLGYTKGNAVPCCGECNLSKHVRTKDEFLSHAFKVVEHYLKQRLHPSTQKEHRILAQQVLCELSGVAPLTMNAFFGSD